MKSTDKKSNVGVLEEWRDHLNNAIIKSDFNLSDPDVVDLSGRVDIMVIGEMRETDLP